MGRVSVSRKSSGRCGTRLRHYPVATRLVSLQQTIEQPLEMIEVHVADVDVAGFARFVLGDRHGATERAGQPLLEVAHRRGLRGCRSRWRGALLRLRIARLLDEILGRPDRELLRDDL